MLAQLDTLIGFVVVMALVSLLVTIFTQIASGVLGLRGCCLANALETVIFKLDNSIGKDARMALINELLTHPSVSDTTLSIEKTYWPREKVPKWWKKWVIVWKRASAIRPDELLELLEELAGTKAPWAAATLQASQVDSANGGLEPVDVKQTALRVLAKLHGMPDASSLNALRALQVALPKLLEAKGTDALKEFQAASNHALNNLERWFNSAQDRAREWFAVNTRCVTVLFSFIVAFALQLDSVALLQQVSSDKELRDSLVKTATDGNLQKIANPILTNPTGLSTGSAGDPTNIDFVIYQQKLVILTNALNGVLQTAHQDGLQLLPQPYPWPFERSPNCPHLTFSSPQRWCWPLHHLFGILLSAGLLSLGAPFWFNILKSLANLRSSLAKGIDEQPKQK